MKNFKSLLAEFSRYRESKGLDPRVPAAQVKMLFEAYKKDLKGKTTVRESMSKKPVNDIEVVIANYKKVKQARLGESKVSYKEVKKLREAVDAANKKGIRMIEADENFAADPAAPAPAAPATAGVSPDVQSQIQSLLQQVQNLATAAGVQLNDFSGDPAADIPPVAGQPATADAAAPAPEAAPQQPMMEAVNAERKANNGKCNEDAFVAIKAKFGKAIVESVGTTKDRIAMRSAKLECMNESYEGDFAGAYFNAIGLKEAANPIEGIPSEKELAKGTADAKGQLAKELKTPVAWPDHQISIGALQGEGAKQQKVKESTESSVADKYVENYYAEKLSFDSIRESMKTGLLG